MSDRSVVVKLRAEVSGYTASMRQAGAATRSMAGEVNKLAKTGDAGMQNLGRAAVVGGAAVAAGLGLSVKAAINWESAWTGVTKTVDGTVGQMAELEDGLRNLATTLPATHEEIAGIAEAAGQLGVKRAAILGFTKTMVDLGETTNLTAEEAATAIAQMANVMQTAPKDVGRLGATLVALGNDGASTEKQIIEMSQRIAGAASVVGLSEGEVLAFANTVASMGIDVEAGGTSVSRVLTDMSKAAQGGGKELDVFAKTAGMSADQFSTAFREKPAEAFAAFIEGLGGVKDAGGNVFAILDQIGLSDVRVSQALLGMASSGDLLRDSLDLQSVAWRENTALTDEARKRYETDAARIQVSMNKIKDAAIDVGAELAPAFAGGAETVGNMASAFGDLPGPVKKSAVAFAGLSSAALLAGGGLIMILPKIAETKKAIDALNLSSSVGAARLGALAKGGIAVAAAFAAVQGLGAIYDNIEGLSPETDALSRSLGKFAETGKASGATADLLGKDLGKLGTALGTLKSDRGTLKEVWDFGAVFSPGDSAWGAATKRVEALDTALTSLAASDDTASAAAAFEQITAAAAQQGVPMERLAELFPQYTEAAGAAATVADALGGASTVAAGSMTVLGTSVGITEEEVDALKNAFVGLNAMLADDSAQISYKQGVDDLRGVFKDLTAEQKRNARSLDVNSQAGRDAKSTLISLISRANEHAQAVLDETGNVDKANNVLGRHRTEIRKTATELGLNKDAVKRLMQVLQDFDGTSANASVDVEGVTSAILSLQNLSAMVRELDGQTFRISGVYSAGSAINSYLAGNKGPKKAAGGRVRGAGTSTSDSIPAWLSDGEYVVKTAAVERYGVGTFEAMNSMRLAGGGHATRKSHGAETTAAAVSAIVGKTSGTSSVADIDAATKAVERLTQAYDDQRAMHGMNAKERARYHAEQTIAAKEERLSIRRDRAADRAEAAKDAKAKKAEHAEMLATNKDEWRFDHMSVESQVLDLDTRIAAEEKYTDKWMTLSRQRESLVESIRQAEAAAAEERRQQLASALTEAIRVRDDYARTVASSITGFGALGSGALLGGTPGQLTGAQVGGTDVLSGAAIARTTAARVGQARSFVANMRALKAAGLNNTSMQEILGMGVVGGSAYAAALLGDVGSITSLNGSQSELAALAGSFGLEASNWFHGAGISNALSAYQMQPQINLSVRIGDRELTDIINVEVNGQSAALANSFVYGRV